MVQIELAGPQLPLTIDLIPNELKSMAAGVLETCTKKPRYVGGFLAGDLGPIRQWISSEPGDLDKPFRSYSSLHLPLPKSQASCPLHNLYHLQSMSSQIDPNHDYQRHRQPTQPSPSLLPSPTISPLATMIPPWRECLRNSSSRRRDGIRRSAGWVICYGKGRFVW